MNRKQRRAGRANSPPAGSGAMPGDAVQRLRAEAMLHQQQNRLQDAARAYRRLVALKPDDARAYNDLGALLLAEGKRREASACFAEALALMPQLFDDFRGLCTTLIRVLPPIGEAMARADAAWPERLPAGRLLDGGIAAIADDPLLLRILGAAPVPNVALERVLTSLRWCLLSNVEDVNQVNLAFACALAKHCFINEYVFPQTEAEEARIETLRAQICATLASDGGIEPAQLAVLAMYVPLRALPQADLLAERRWPAAVDEIVTQQVRESMQEKKLMATIARFTAIDDDVSRRVRAQYEENPYPRWVNAAAGVEPVAIDLYLRDLFPTAGFLPLSKTDAIDVLVAGCGTGWQAIGTTQRFLDVRILAVDLSLASLAYAKRKTPPALTSRIDYAQADILKLGSLQRRFDMIDSSGVLHHLADPFAGWRILLGLLKPGGLMHLGLYSALARADVIKARAFVAEHGYQPTTDSVRRCRQDLLGTPLRSLVRFHDFFSTSECRDLLFHVQESNLGIPDLKAFISGQGLKFIGFEFGQAAQRHYRATFAQRGWSTSDLDRWHEVETQAPETFSGMYNFWVQKT